MCFLDSSQNMLMRIFVTTSALLFWHLNHVAFCLFSGQLGLLVTSFNLSRSFQPFLVFLPTSFFVLKEWGPISPHPPGYSPNTCVCPQGWASCVTGSSLRAGVLMVLSKSVEWRSYWVQGNRKSNDWRLPGRLASAEGKEWALVRRSFPRKKGLATPETNHGPSSPRAVRSSLKQVQWQNLN